GRIEAARQTLSLVEEAHRGVLVRIGQGRGLADQCVHISGRKVIPHRLVDLRGPGVVVGELDEYIARPELPSGPVVGPPESKSELGQSGPAGRPGAHAELQQIDGALPASDVAELEAAI